MTPLPKEAGQFLKAAPKSTGLKLFNMAPGKWGARAAGGLISMSAKIGAVEGARSPSLSDRHHRNGIPCPVARPWTPGLYLPSSDGIS